MRVNSRRRHTSACAQEAPSAEELQALFSSSPARAVAELRSLALDGDPHAQLLLGQLLVNGVGAARDMHGALRWFKGAARAQVPMAMNMVGRCYEYGLGTAVDYVAAAHWYYRAATFDCDWAIYNYAHLLANGRGVEKDQVAALAWFRLAASRGHARAMHFLGEYLEKGWGTPSDLDAAISWYRRSAEGGDFRGQCSYASVLVEQGRIEEALHWLQLASKTATPAYLLALAPILEKSSHERIRGFSRAIRPASVGAQQANADSRPVTGGA